MTSPNENYISWHVGMKLECIATAEQVAALRAKIPGANIAVSKGIYTIREIRDDAPWRGGDHHIVVLLQEIDNRHLVGSSYEQGKYCHVEPGFGTHGFRPVVTRPTSIAIFQSILSNPRKKLHTEDA